MDIDFDLDTRNLEQLFRNLSLKRQQRLIYNSLKQIAGRTRKLVQQEASYTFGTRLRSGKPRKKGMSRALGRASFPRKDVAKGVQSKVWSRKVGFKVFISKDKKECMHKNRRGKSKPVLFWRNVGTGVRCNRRGNRGAMLSKPFMKAAGYKYDSNTIAEFEKILITSINKTSRKYGARLT